MAIKQQKTHSSMPRKAPPLRRLKSGPIMVGGAQTASERRARMMAAAITSEGRASATPGLVPRTAPGQAAEPAPQIAEAAIHNLGAGRTLTAAETARFEPAFDADLSAVRIHQGTQADQATRALDARAFALGADIALSPAADTAETLAHELAHVVEAGAPYLMRELIRQPPGREAEPDPLTAAETAEATAYNQRRFNRTSTEAILDILGDAGRIEFAPEHVPEIQNWQADFRLPTDGKIGLRTVEPIGKEMMASGLRNPVIQFIIDAHNFDTSNVASITYDRTLAGANATTAPNWGGSSDIRVSPIGFRQGWRGLVHTIRHEIVHADQVAGMAAPADIEDVRPIMEFQAETTEILSRGMLLEGVGGLFNDAARAFGFWGLMSAAEKRAEWGNFQRVRNELRRRFEAASATTQARHQAVMDSFIGEAAP